MSEKPIPVIDPFGAAKDSEIPSVKLAIDPAVVGEEFKHALPRLSGPEGRIHLRKITVIRHKPGRRCVIEYAVKVRLPGQPPQKAELLGKIRARRFGNEGYRLQDAIWNAGFQSDSSDGVSVPEPLGVIPELKMWVQRKVPGKTAEGMFKELGPALGTRIAEAIHKLHCAKIATERRHTIGDELQVLREHLPKVTQYYPGLSDRIKGVLKASERLAATVPEPRFCGIHRDFYTAQVLVGGARLYLIDFDLYCQGDPGLDIGNFLGHTTEDSLRKGDPHKLQDCEAALEERFVQLTGERIRPAIHAYKVLTLVRHIYISTQFDERRPFTEKILAFCEKLLKRI